MWAKILLLFFVFSFLFRTDHSFDQDLGRHLKLGEIIWQTKNVPLTNLFSYTYPDFPFINSHWFFELLVYLGQQTIGLQAVLVLKVVIFLLSVWLVLKTIPKNQYLLLPVGFIFLHTLRERPDLRPEIFSFLFTASTYFILEKYLKSPTKLLYLLPIIQLVWINTHIYFFVGLSLQAIFLIHLASQNLRLHPKGVKLKLLVFIFGLSVVVSLANPSGLAGFLNPFTFNQNYGYTIVENQTMFLLESINFRNPNFLFVKLAAATILLSTAVALFKKRLLIKNLLLAGFGLTLALANVRSFPYLVFISLPAILENFGIPKPVLFRKLFTIITVPLLLLESYFYLNGDYYKYTSSDDRPKLEFKESGRNALDFVLKNNLPQPVFNNFDIGSYITYRGWPKYRVFVDGRPGEYPKEFFQNVYIPAQSDPQKFKELDQKIGFKTIVFSHTDQTPWGKAFLTSVVKDPDWRIVYVDDFMIILVKNNVVASQGVPLEPIDLSKLDPGRYRFDSHLSYLRLSLFLSQTGNLESAQEFAKRGLAIFPASPLGNALFGISTSNKFFW
ncbi:MAG: hypothetical protein PHV63_02140 [Candidatus Daviesbacteria bacterium]|nr:hypothetical protein [Candidatus Daviesbacteria bacterium]